MQFNLLLFAFGVATGLALLGLPLAVLRRRQARLVGKDDGKPDPLLDVPVKEGEPAWKEHIWDLYSQTWDEEKYYMTDFHRRLTFFGTFIPALMVGTLAAAAQANEANEYVLLCFASMLVIGMGEVSRLALPRAYQRFLESVVRKAKLEHDLEMHLPRSEDATAPWTAREPLVDRRHYRERHYIEQYGTGRRDFTSSREFIENRIQRGTRRHYEILILVIEGVAVLMLAYFAAAAWMSLP